MALGHVAHSHQNLPTPSPYRVIIIFWHRQRLIAHTKPLALQLGVDGNLADGLSQVKFFLHGTREQSASHGTGDTPAQLIKIVVSFCWELLEVFVFAGPWLDTELGDLSSKSSFFPYGSRSYRRSLHQLTAVV